jgi:CRP-like cAMP-binding protein
VIESGEAIVSVHGEERARLGRGDYFGDVAMIDRVRAHGHDPRRLRPQVLRLAFWDFRPLVESDARIAWPLLQAMAKRLRAAESEA